MTNISVISGKIAFGAAFSGKKRAFRQARAAPPGISLHSGRHSGKKNTPSPGRRLDRLRGRRGFLFWERGSRHKLIRHTPRQNGKAECGHRTDQKPQKVSLAFSLKFAYHKTSPGENRGTRQSRDARVKVPERRGVAFRTKGNPSPQCVSRIPLPHQGTGFLCAAYCRNLEEVFLCPK